MAIEASSRHNGARHAVTTDAKAGKARPNGFSGLAGADAGVAGDFMAILATLGALDTDTDTTEVTNSAVGAVMPEWTPTLTDTNAAMATPTDASMVLAQASLAASLSGQVSTAEPPVRDGVPAPAPDARAVTKSPPLQTLPEPPGPPGPPGLPGDGQPPLDVTHATSEQVAQPVRNDVMDASAPTIGADLMATSSGVQTPPDVLAQISSSVSMRGQVSTASATKSPSLQVLTELPGLSEKVQTPLDATHVTRAISESDVLSQISPAVFVRGQVSAAEPVRDGVLAPILDKRSTAKSPRLQIPSEEVLSPSNVLSPVVSEPAVESGKNTSKTYMDALVRLTQGEASTHTNSTESGVLHDRHVLNLIQRLTDPSVAAQPTAFAMPMLDIPTTLTRRDERVRERSVFQNHADDATSLFQPMMTGSTGTFAANASEVLTPTDTYVAEQVSYWISNGVQNAELKLDDLGNNPVEVSIRMHGNEAHVAFRTDELQTRTALENASLHLKNLLQSEGVILSGVSVGTTGSGGAGNQQQQQPQQRPRQFTTALIPPGRSDMDSIAGRVTKNTLDLFV